MAASLSGAWSFFSINIPGCVDSGWRVSTVTPGTELLRAHPLLTLRGRSPHAVVFQDIAAPHLTAHSSYTLPQQPLPSSVFRVSESRDGRRPWLELRDRSRLEEEEVCRLRFLLGILEIAFAQEHLLSRLEGWHPKVGAVGTAESITQVAISTG